MNLKLHISFLSAGLLAASSMALVFFFGNWFDGLQLRVRIYSLWSPMPMFLLAGSLAGWGCGRGWRSITSFGLASLLPGFWIPTAMMGTQGAHGTVDLFLLTTGVPTVTYLFVGMIGGYVSFRSLRAAISVAAGFAIGAILGPVLAWLLRPMTVDPALVGWCLGCRTILATPGFPAHAGRTVKRSSGNQPFREVMKSLRNSPPSTMEVDNRHGLNSNAALNPHRRAFAAVQVPLRSLLLAVALLSGADAVMAQGVANLRADSFVQRNTEVELRLRFPTVWGRRYRVETSTNLLQWETTTITDAMRESAAAVSVKGPTSESRFYRVSAFDWEELRSELKVARELWRTRGPATYRFEFRWNCYCLPDLREWVRVDVRDRVLVGVTRLTDGEALPPDRWSHRTVDGMFQWIEGKLADHPEVLRVRFDPELGYPSDGYCDASSMLADEEMGFELKSVLPP